MPNKIYSHFDRPITIAAPECPIDELTYIEKIDKNGHSFLVEGERVPFYDNIQKYKDECDIYKILKRFEDGDPDIIDRLSRKAGQYGDFTDLPVDILDVKNKLNSAENLFNSLPMDERNAYENNVNIFLSELTKGNLPVSLQKALGVYVEPEEVPVSNKIENKIDQATESGKATIHDAINGQGGNV